MIKAYYIVITITSNNQDNEALQTWKVNNACATSQDQFVPLSTDPCFRLLPRFCKILAWLMRPHPHAVQRFYESPDKSEPVIRKTAA